MQRTLSRPFLVRAITTSLTEGSGGRQVGIYGYIKAESLVGFALSGRSRALFITSTDNLH